MDSDILLSIIMPAHNEGRNLPSTLRKVIGVLSEAAIPFEIIVVNDHSQDDTPQAVNNISRDDPRVKLVENIYQRGFGYAVRRGLEVFSLSAPSMGRRIFGRQGLLLRY